MSDTDVTSAALDADLREQWDAIIDWVRGLDDDVLTTPTPLAGWLVRDLIAHLALAMGVLAGAEPAPPEARRDHDLASYLRSYADNDRGIRDGAVDLANGADPVAAAEAAGERALAHLASLRASNTQSVRVRRGIVALDTLVLTRLIELVVHGDDLARAVPVPSPVDPTARTIVSAAFLRVLTSRTGYELRVGDERRWIRVAAGRLGWQERGEALVAANLSEGVPDLRSQLPLL